MSFASFATNLVPGDTNRDGDAFVHDRRTGRTERVNVGYDGSEANGVPGPDAAVTISADGRIVVFASFATNLVPGDINGRADLFAYDRKTGKTELVTVSSDEVQASGSESFGAGLSADGRFVVFVSTATNLVCAGDTNNADDVFVRDRKLGTTERVNVSSAGAQSNAETFNQVGMSGGWALRGLRPQRRHPRPGWRLPTRPSPRPRPSERNDGNGWTRASTSPATPRSPRRAASWCSGVPGDAGRLPDPASTSTTG